jgi:hypothetical protein
MGKLVCPKIGNGSGMDIAMGFGRKFMRAFLNP